MDGVFDKAITDYYNNAFRGPLLINNHYGEPDEMPLGVYFREEAELSGIESYALSLCNGHILDVGAGVGALSLILQSKGFVVEALENSIICCDIMQARGVKKVLHDDFFNLDNSSSYDSLLLMMNGVGICQTFDMLPLLFGQFSKLLKPGGQVLFDSSNVSYVYDQTQLTGHYFGEIDYQYEYAGEKGSWFKWLYVDIDTIRTQALQFGYHMQVLSEDSNGQYLARLKRI